jgi:hypothetical protein
MFLSPDAIHLAYSCQSSPSKSVEAFSGGLASIRKPSPVFAGSGILQPSPVFAGSGILQPSPTVDLTAATADLSAFCRLSPIPTSVLAANGSTIIPSSSLFSPIKDLVAIVDGSTIILSLTVDDSGIALGRDTPSGIGDSKPIDVMATCKEEKKGWDRGAIPQNSVESEASSFGG